MEFPGTGASFPGEPVLRSATGAWVEVSGPVPTARIDAPVSGDEGVEIILDGGASTPTDPADTIVSHEWDLGDGSTLEGAVVSHAYADDGTCTATLTVTNDLEE